jgi:hypothetical protein
MNKFDLLSSNAIKKDSKTISSILWNNFYQSKTNDFGGQVYLGESLEDYYKTNKTKPGTLEDNPLVNIREVFETNMINFEIREANFPLGSKVPKADFLYFEVYKI